MLSTLSKTFYSKPLNKKYVDNDFDLYEGGKYGYFFY